MKTRLNCWLAIVLLFQTLTPLPAQTNHPVKWAKEMAEFAASDATNPPPKHAIVFTGSSSIRFWASLAEDFPGKQVFNRGFGGSQISDAIEHTDQIVFPYEPRIIVFYSGDNDLNAGKSPEQVFADFKTFVAKVHTQLPDTIIVTISIKPCPARWKLKDQVMDVNNHIKALSQSDPKLRFVDITPLMLDDNGQSKKDLFKPDGLHPSQKCYKLWSKQIAPYLD
jgi:lysophospholipase L1-like esterase